jgi:hypothetical protein
VFVPADLPAGQHDRDGAPESCSGALCSPPSGTRLAIDAPGEKRKRNSHVTSWFATTLEQKRKGVFGCVDDRPRRFSMAEAARKSAKACPEGNSYIDFSRKGLP